MRSLARWCFRHRRWVLAIWLVALIGSSALSQAAGTKFATKFQLSSTESGKALTLLQKDFPAVSGSSDQIVLHATSGTVRDPAIQARVSAMLAKVATLPDVRTVTSPYSARGAGQVSKDGTVAFATVVFDGSQTNPKADVKQVISTAQAAADSQLQVALGGQDIEQAQQQSSNSSTGLGVLFALIVLGVAFGALFAAFLPIITALVAIGIGYALTGLASHVFSVAEFATILGILIGLGVGVDYALFIVTRHRAGLKAGRDVEESAVIAVNTAGRAVFFAGITVCIALLGQFALGLSFLYGVAVSASVTVILTMLASLTLLPSLLGFFGMKVLSRKQRASLAANGPVDEAVVGFWARWAGFIQRTPTLPAIAALLVVVVVALPVLTLRLGLDDAGTDPPGSTTLQAYTLLAKGFGPGVSGPFQIVGELPSPSAQPAFAALTKALAKEPGVVSVGPPVVSPDGLVAVANLYPATSPQSKATTSLLHRLRGQAVPKAVAGTGITVLVGGATAIQSDFSHILSSKLPLFLAVVVILGFILLMAVFRSLLVPLIASVMNLLSVGAALGIMNAVFEWGWGHSLFRISEKAPVEVFIPVLLISILFGLSMDYEVFLVSRMHEEWAHSRDNQRAVTTGQAATGRVITAAASIMILVFASFALGDNVIIKQFGIGLAGAIIIDAFVVRTVLVPALMHLFGPRNWWLPGWLDRAIPQLNVEGADSAGSVGGQPEPVLTGR
ncbi:MMPL family transporter [Acidiferrimicrobium sp. IK]|uniref:MMPL family transporter n=1 Tax=Acidiferrimicrobium sp. IK TaxID=2871700 RepID=UPI0021CAFE7C|nr:MMPL family transporter [Acidiferrimicrobium sp. IK]MCU4186075.1 MMPL family transporter [Acidiferrimicrobium sp. IK]